jgi:hypothetical protein
VCETNVYHHTYEFFNGYITFVFNTKYVSACILQVVVPKYGDYAEPQQIGEPRRYQVAGQVFFSIIFYSL